MAFNSLIFRGAGSLHAVDTMADGQSFPYFHSLLDILSLPGYYDLKNPLFPIQSSSFSPSLTSVHCPPLPPSPLSFPLPSLSFVLDWHSSTFSLPLSSLSLGDVSLFLRCLYHHSKAVLPAQVFLSNYRHIYCSLNLIFTLGGTGTLTWYLVLSLMMEVTK